MKYYLLIISLSICTLIGCQLNNETSNTYNELKIAGAMKNVMWKGELNGIINLDTINNKTGLYGLGPLEFLTGEILINNGEVYVSRVLADSSISVVKEPSVGAPFFVYGNVTEWNELELPKTIKNIKNLEEFVDSTTKKQKRPFAFKLEGTISQASIHIQNLPLNSTVSSPQEAHQGQVNYELQNEEVEIIGFFSTEHQGVFTHHDSFLHMHLITQDETKMGHLDKVEFDQVRLFLPK